MVTSAFEEQPIVFDCEGERLVGIVATPSRESSVGVIIVVGGPQYRVGSHRQFVLLARRLAREGVAVMRFDYRGMGDSSGRTVSFEDAMPDVSAAMAAFVEACPSVERIVFWGLCDAASAGLLYWHTTRDTRIAGMVLADPWIVTSEAFAQSQVRHYLRRPFQRDFWTKVMRGGIDFAGAFKDALDVLRTARRKREAKAAATALPFQDRMALGMESFPGPILVILSGDLPAREFVQYCDAHPRWQDLMRRTNVARAEVPDANHTFATVSSRAEVEALTLQWLTRRLLSSGSG